MKFVYIACIYNIYDKDLVTFKSKVFDGDKLIVFFGLEI